MLACAATLDAAPLAQSYVVQDHAETGIHSDTDLVVSLGYMRHSWLAGDDMVAAVVQQGGHQGRGLTLYKSSLDGLEWTLDAELSTLDFIVADGILLPDKSLLLVTSAINVEPVANVDFLRLSYDPLTEHWTLDPATPRPVYVSAPTMKASRATLAMDSKGVLWCVFRLQDVAKNNFRLRLFYSTNGGIQWKDSLNVFGSPNGQEGKSGKVLAVGGRILVVFQDAQGPSLNPVRFKGWSFRNDNQPLKAKIQPNLIAAMTASSGDPLGTHWSVAPDAGGNLHMSYQDNGIRYLRYDASSQTWTTPFALQFSGNYNNLSVSSDGDLVVFAHSNLTDTISFKHLTAATQQWSDWAPASAPTHLVPEHLCAPESFDNRLPCLYHGNGVAPYELFYCLLAK